MKETCTFSPQDLKSPFVWQILDSIEAGISILDPQMRIIAANAWTRRLYSHHQPLEGKLCYRVYQERDQACPWCPVVRALETETTQRAEVPYTREGEIQGHLEITVYPLLDESGRMEGVIQHLQDISSRVQARQELEAEKETFRLFADPTVNWEYWISPQREIIYTSPACQEVTGYTPREFIQDPDLLFRIVHPEDKALLQNHEELFLPESHQCCQLQFRIINRKGELRWINHRCRPVFDSRNNYQGRRVSHSDITKRKEAEEELRLANRSLQLLNLTNEVMDRTRSKSELWVVVCSLLVNLGNYVLAWIGLAREEPEKLVLPVAQAGFEPGYLEEITVTWDQSSTGQGPTGRAIRLGKPQVCQNILTDPRFQPWREQAQKYGYASSVALPLIQEDQTVGALNIYSRKPEAFEARELEFLQRLADNLAFGMQALDTWNMLKQSESHLRQAQHGAGMGSWTSDPAGNHIQLSDEAYRVLELPLDTPITQEIISLRVHPEDRERFYQEWKQAMESGRPFDNVHRLRVGDKIKWVRMCCEAQRNGQGNVLNRLGMVQDITQQKENEFKEKELLEQLQQASKLAALGTLVSSVGHEINNPNSFIMLNTPMIQEAWQDALPILEEHSARHGDFHLAGIPFSDMSRHLPGLLKGIIEGSQRIKNIVADLKGFAGQNSQLTFERVDLNQLVEKALRLTQHKISKHTDNFQVVYGEDLPAISGDFQKLEQVVMNLLLNACQALNHRNEAVTLRTRCDPQGEAVLLEVEDEGCGIDPRDQERLLDPFFTTRSREGGTGLGLSITSSIVQDHGGLLEYYSQPDQGTIFRVYLPAAGMSDYMQNHRHQAESKEQ